MKKQDRAIKSSETEAIKSSGKGLDSIMRKLEKGPGSIMTKLEKELIEDLDIIAITVTIMVTIMVTTTDQTTWAQAMNPKISQAEGEVVDLDTPEEEVEAVDSTD